jgi:Tol biopolymer transport system component
VKKLCVILAIAFPMLSATSDGKAQGHTFPGLPVLYVSRIAFGSRASTPTSFNSGERADASPGEISVIDAPNPNPRVLANGRGPVFSFDAAKVAFCLADDRGIFHAQIINADGTGQAKLETLKPAVCPSDWSPDGRRISLTDLSGKAPMVAIADVDGANFKAITTGSDPQWSPDGTQLVFYRAVIEKANTTAIWIVNVDGTGARKIIEEDTPSGPSVTWNYSGPARFFDGNRIVFSSERAHNWSIFRVNLDGTGLEKLVESDQYDLFYPSFSPDDKHLVVQGDSRSVGTTAKSEKLILLLDLSTKQWNQLAAGTYPSVLWGTKSQWGDVILARGSMLSSNSSPIAQGKTRYADYKCGDCHGANGEGGPDGPDLTTTYMDAGMISRFLEKPSPDAYMKGMPSIPATHPDNKALVAYIVSLKRPPTSQ